MARVSFRLAHLTDPHIGPLPSLRRRELLGKRATGYFNWRRGRHLVHDMGVLAHIVADMRAQSPDHVAMTGDITNLGLPAEFQAARRWLEGLGAPEDVSFVPGNHDAYVRGSLPDLARAFAPWTTGGTDPDRERRYPYLRVRGKVAVVGLSSAVPTPMFIASGRLGRRQIAEAEAILARCGREHLVRVVLLHHPPQIDPASLARGLIDARDFSDMLRRQGAELILHGHNHKASVRYLEGPRGRIPVVGAPSASSARTAARQCAAYHVFEIEGTGRDYEIRGFSRGATEGGIGPLGRLVFDPSGAPAAA
ncbi:metallophosphoesterase family protein [Methylocella sp.]|uniref:metallophosphoesterase family protein n=1 Tax=Methylocella sp. TaxID=1978226 RepID=UPI00378494C1